MECLEVKESQITYRDIVTAMVERVSLMLMAFTFEVFGANGEVDQVVNQYD
jgi:hypothetical protein